MEIKLPHLGDGVDSAQVLSIQVSVGDEISAEQTIMELETDKAVAPIPSPSAGKVEKILVKEGDTVSTGTPVVVLAGGAGAASASAADSAPASAPAPSAAPASAPAAPAVQVQQSHVSAAQYVPQGGEAGPTSPAIRHMASQFGLDLARIPGTGHGGRITNDDVRGYFSFLQSKAFQEVAPSSSGSTESSAPQKKPLNIDFAKYGKISIEKLPSLRNKIADNMANAWTTIPHVTQFDEASITDLMALRKKYKDKYAKKGTNITVTVFILKAIVDALKEFPQFNASYDAAKGEIIYKEYYHIGIAVDTEAGLIVPVIRDVDKKSILELSKELAEVAEKARDRKLSVDDLKGATFTISNLGSLGVGPFTPIVNHPEVAILGVSRGVQRPQLNDKKQLENQLIMPLSLSYDHRVIDGADGARFIRRLIDALESFDEALLKE